MSWRGQRQAHPLLPAALVTCLKRLPAYPGSLLFAQALNCTIASQMPDDVKAMLEGKCLRLRVNDAGLVFDFHWQTTRFAPLKAGGQPDLTIGSAMHDLWLLARREEDPDSLFFGRRLTLEGDTELGLLFKNTIDALDFSTIDLLLRWLPAFASAPLKKAQPS
ncbi:ubiquinone anaerobic biosynthesis accessory factor UbiT [Massilia cavernae]|uniref:Ubiquinone biosynthesis accessory factor UbiT n=1 Tax=Massilia cavernae TaxID=2320864 RepID=A0A418XA78_9BURK|nr:SCP2 sterol-binding domain-containing protein [Massilia cavernae]RJG09384.1 sterol-binding protein [Massilia cavernae]